MVAEHTTAFYLVLLETSGNQAYIFDTNKLRHVMGASEIIHRTGRSFVKEALEKVFGGARFDPAYVEGQKPIEESQEQFEVLLATSGKAVILFRDRGKAAEFISAWSNKILKESPGVDATGVISSSPVDMARPLLVDEVGSLPWALQDVHRQFEKVRRMRPPVSGRFPRVPFAADCSFSGLPAEGISKVWAPPQPASSVCLKKEQAGRSNEFRERFRRLFEGTGLAPFGDITEMEQKMEELSWLGVIHADGNGMGRIFMEFHNYLQPGGDKLPGRCFADAYRGFSVALDSLGEEAFKTAVKEVFGNEKSSSDKVPVLPVVVGGDDMTVIIDGKKALAFTCAYLKHFCSLSEKDENIKNVLKSPKAYDDLGAKRIGVSAGVSIAKPHFPFHASYSLAEELLKSAKTSKRRANPATSSLDFHILYDSTVRDLSIIRELLSRERMTLTAKPFVFERAGEPRDKEWADTHDYERFLKAVFALKSREKEDEKTRALPSSQAHGFRNVLVSETREVCDAGWGALLDRYPRFAETWNKEVPLFEDNTGTTVFLDALEALDFTAEPGQKEEAGKEAQHQ